MKDALYLGRSTTISKAQISMPLLTRATRQRIQAARIVRNTSRCILLSQRVRPEQQAFEQLPVEIEIDISEATTMSSVTER